MARPGRNLRRSRLVGGEPWKDTRSPLSVWLPARIKETEMALFQELAAIDVLDPIIKLYPVIPARGKILLKSTIGLPHPWIHSVYSTDRNCGYWTFIFNNYRLIPEGCRKCWKIAFTVKTLKEAFYVVELQRERGQPSKVGMEKRDFTSAKGGYSAFWYCPLGCALSEAKQNYKEIKALLEDKLGRETDLILKRGCTEMERLHPPSDMWDKYAEAGGWDKKKALIDSVLEPDDAWKDPKMRSEVEVNTRLRMIHWAFENAKVTGDYSWKEYVDGPGLPPLKPYQDSNYSDRKFPMGGLDEQDNSRHEDAKEGIADVLQIETETGRAVSRDGGRIALL